MTTSVYTRLANRFRKSPRIPDWPIAPRNVSAVYRDGRKIPLQVVFTAVHGGVYEWTVQPTGDLIPGDYEIMAEVMPPETLIVFDPSKW